MIRSFQKFFLILIFFFVAVHPLLATEQTDKVNAVEFANALKIVNFTSYFSAEIHNDGQNILNINGYVESEEDNVYSVFSLYFSNFVSLIANNYLNRQIEGRYVVKMNSVSNLRNLQEEDDFLDVLTETPIFVKLPGSTEFVSCSEGIAALLEYSQDMYSNVDISQIFRYKVFDFSEFNYSNGKYVKTFINDNMEGELSLTFANKQISELELSLSFVSNNPFLMRTSNIDINFYSKYSKIGGTNITKK